MKITFLAILLLPCAAKLMAQAGSLDNTFGNGTGKVATLVGSIGCYGAAVALQSDGKIVVAGTYTRADATQHNFAIIRYKHDGSLDNSFAGNGKLGIAFSGNDGANAMLVQPDKKILVAGYSDGYGAIARVNKDGTLDGNFGTGGKLLLTGFGIGFHIYSVALNAAGQIVIAGTGPGYYSVFVARLDSDGSPDTGFGTGGVTVTTLVYNIISSCRMALQANGQPALMVTVNTSPNMDHQTSIAVLRYTKDGALDPSFAGIGYEYVTAGVEQSADGYAITIDQQQRILVAGDYYTPGNYPDPNYGYTHANYLLLRFNIDGTLDNSFAGNGKKGINFLVDELIKSDDYAGAIAVQPDGYIVTAGTTLTKDHRYFSCARVSTTGTLDDNFSGNGKVATRIDSIFSTNAVAIDQNQKIVVVGTAGNSIFVLRYLGATPPIIGPLPPVPAASLKFALLAGVYPNPATNAINVTGLNPETVTALTIIDMAGKTCYAGSTAFSNTAVISTEKLTPGVYLLQLVENNQRTIIKFVKK